MRYIITGSAGNISKPLSKQLLNAGHEVTVIGRNMTHLQELVNIGAHVAVGANIGMPGLKWVKLSNEQVLQGMMESGVSKELARDFVEMFNAINNDELWKKYREHRPAQFTGVKLEDVATMFAKIYGAN
ncbi:MAG TPA: hypothetical protein VFW07_00835 [Parafilimonas sp.]|nr:hypothetical protein [Parafilimonas sp.]